MLSGSCFYFIFYFISFSLPYDVHHLPLGSRPLATCSRCMCGVCSVHSTHTHKHTFLVGAHHFITWGRTRTRARGDTITFIKKQINENYSKLLGQVDIERKIHEPWTFSFKCAQIFRYDAGPTPPDAYSIILYYYAHFFYFYCSSQLPHGHIAACGPSFISMFGIRFCCIYTIISCRRLDFNLLIALLKFDPIIYFFSYNVRCVVLFVRLEWRVRAILAFLVLQHTKNLIKIVIVTACSVHTTLQCAVLCMNRAIWGSNECFWMLMQTFIIGLITEK